MRNSEPEASESFVPVFRRLERGTERNAQPVDQEAAAPGLPDNGQQAIQQETVIYRPAKGSQRATAQIVLSIKSKTALVGAGFALVAAFSATQTWAYALFISISGTDTDRGVIALMAAVIGAGVSVWRGLFGLRNSWFIGVGAVTSALMVSLPAWMLADIIREPPAQIFATDVRILTPGWPLYLALGASGAFAFSILWQAGEAVTSRRA